MRCSKLGRGDVVDAPGEMKWCLMRSKYDLYLGKQDPCSLVLHILLSSRINIFSLQ